MTAAVTERIRDRVQQIETTPSIPAVFLPLLELLNAPPESVKFEEVVKLVSYDNTIAAQCLRVASSPLFGLAKPPNSIKGAVITLGLRRVETILLTCCMGQAFPMGNWALDPSVFWRHSLGCAMVCRRLSEKIGAGDHDKAYMAGLLHDIGFLVNCIAFPKEFEGAVRQAVQQQIPLDEAEQSAMGFTHTETGRALAEKWHLADDLIQVIEYHHAPDQCQPTQSLPAIVHLGDILCRVRGMGYGYYESHKVDLINDPAWTILQKTHDELAGTDLVRFTFEMDDAAAEIFELVATIFGGAAPRS